MKFKELEYEGNTYQVPVVENLCQKVWEAVQVEGAYEQRWFHSNYNHEQGCDTAHCFAGHIIHQTGKAGYAFKEGSPPEYGTSDAAQMIFEVSTGEKISNDWFSSYADPKKVLAEIKRLAMEERDGTI